jgi:galactokinase
VSVEKALELFEQHFGCPAAVVASAPARVNIIGEHTDYNGGEVLPIAIERRTYIAMSVARGERSRAVSANERDAGSFDARTPSRSGRWWDYVAGTVARRAMPNAPRAIDVAVWSDVPAGAGLSSSAALEVGVAAGFDELAGTPLDRRGIALASHRAENDFVGVASGIMDQFASALAERGQALHLWCDTMAVEQVPMPDAVLIFDTAVPRSLRTSQFNTRRSECEAALTLLRQRYAALPHLAAATPDQIAEARLPQPLAKRARHVVTETRRVQSVVDALRAGGEPPGDLLLASHRSLRDDYECSTPELDWFVERATRVAGIRGARLTGAGWGGCAIAIGDPNALRDASGDLAAEYESAFGRTPRLWHTHADDGVRVERS